MEIELGETAIFPPGSEIVVLCGKKSVEFYKNLRCPVANLKGGFLIPLKGGKNPKNPDRYDEEETRFLPSPPNSSWMNRWMASRTLRNASLLSSSDPETPAGSSKLLWIRFPFPRISTPTFPITSIARE
jgi:hypothetical protein